GVGSRRTPPHRTPAVSDFGQFGQRGLVERTFEYFASPTAPAGVRGDLGGLCHFSIVAAGVPTAETGMADADKKRYRLLASTFRRSRAAGRGRPCPRRQGCRLCMHIPTAERPTTAAPTR